MAVRPESSLHPVQLMAAGLEQSRLDDISRLFPTSVYDVQPILQCEAVALPCQSLWKFSALSFFTADVHRKTYTGLTCSDFRIGPLLF